MLPTDISQLRNLQRVVSTIIHHTSHRKCRLKEIQVFSKLSLTRQSIYVIIFLEKHIIVK